MDNLSDWDLKVEARKYQIEPAQFETIDELRAHLKTVIKNTKKENSVIRTAPQTKRGSSKRRKV